jgi:EAL domain-containing protein (putative c-di-GMP-specific phosphodiesterase class I)
VRVALDNFGSSLAAFNNLVRLPIDFVKLDSQLSIAAVKTGSQLALLESVIRLGKTIGVQSLAQGVETQEQLDSLRRLGCELGQGPLFSPAVDAAGALEIAVERQRALPPSL